MKYLKYFLIVFILLLTPKVFALEYNMNSKTSATFNGTKNRYLGTEIYNTGTTNTYTFGTRYNGKLSSIDTYFDYPFEANTTYTLTYNMNTEDFRNNFGGKYWWDCSDTMNATNQHVGNFTYVSYKKVKFSFTPSENTTCIRVLLGSTNLSSTPITGVSNWQLDSITLYDPDYQSGSSGGQGSTSTPTPTPNTNQDIINNQNNNTQDIINNNNQNTSDVIENNNENTDRIIDNMSDDCTNLINLQDLTLVKNDNRTYNYYLPNTLPAGTYTLSYKYNKIGLPTTYTQLLLNSSAVSYILLNESGKNTFTTSTDFNRFYIFIDNNSPSGSIVNLSDFMLVEGTEAKPYCKYGSKVNKLDQTNQYLMDDSDPNISDNDFMTMFNSLNINDPLNYLLTLPTQLINKMVSLSGSCSPIELGSLYGTMITLPCINLENIIGSSVWNIIDVIFSVSLLVVIFKNLYDTFSNLLTMGAQKEAKEKFSMPTPMDFLSMILGGDR